MHSPAPRERNCPNPGGGRYARTRCRYPLERDRRRSRDWVPTLRSPSMTTVTLYTKTDCCLCDEALEVIERVRREHRFVLEKIDITNDPLLLDRHAERIPVVLVNGAEAFLYRVDEQALRRLVAVPAVAAT